MVQVFPGLETEMDLESIKILGTFFSKQDIIVNRTLFKKKKNYYFYYSGLYKSWLILLLWIWNIQVWDK